MSRFHWISAAFMSGVSAALIDIGKSKFWAAYCGFGVLIFSADGIAGAIKERPVAPLEEK